MPERHRLAGDERTVNGFDALMQVAVNVAVRICHEQDLAPDKNHALGYSAKLLVDASDLADAAAGAGCEGNNTGSDGHVLRNGIPERLSPSFATRHDHGSLSLMSCYAH